MRTYTKLEDWQNVLSGKSERQIYLIIDAELLGNVTNASEILRYGIGFAVKKVYKRNVAFMTQPQSADACRYLFTGG